MRRISAVKGLVGLGVICGLIFWSNTGDAVSSKGKTAVPDRPVKVARVETLSQGPSVTLHGMTRSASHAKVAFAIGGRIKKRLVEVGDRVKKGQVLARIDPEAFRHAVEAGEANYLEIEARLSQAVRESNRMAVLAESGAVSDSQEEGVYASKNALAAARERVAVQVKEAKRQLKESTLRSPISGEITAVLHEPGEMVEAGTPIVILDGAGSVEVALEVPESLVTQVKVGDSLFVELPLVGIHDITGMVTQIGRSSLGPGGLFPVVVSLPADATLQSGLTAEVAFPTGTSAHLGVPTQAVINPSGASASVLKVQNGTVERVSVDTHHLVGDMVAITGKLSVDDLVITAGHQQLIGGEKVEVLP